MTTQERQSGAEIEANAQKVGGVRGWVLRSGIERALGLQHRLVAGHVAAVRRKNPQATPAEVVAALGKKYQIAVATTGGAGGARDDADEGTEVRSPPTARCGARRDEPVRPNGAHFGR